MASIIGSADPETLDGTEDADTIKGLGGGDTLNGLGGNDSLDGGAGVDSMDGGTGDDLFYVDQAGDLIFEAPFEGSDTVITNVSFALGIGQEVELLRTYGSATTNAINLTGNELANTLLGNAGTNTLKGGAGADYLRGYAGNDTYWVDNAGDQVIEASGGGNDTVIATTSFVLGSGQEVETLRTLGSATTDAINFTGNAFAQALYGNAGANVLDGQGGADTMVGYAGDDTYYVDHAGDSVIEVVGRGSDTVITSVSYALGDSAELELLRTYGSATTDAIDLTGNGFANTLLGNAAANVLNGKGGADLLRGYAGNDTYYVDNAADAIVEAAGQGSDTVYTNVSYTLAAGVSVERLATYGTLTTTPIDLTGNELIQTLVGNAADNVLDGGAGADILQGYGGNDTYYVDNPGDTIVERRPSGHDAGGHDLVITSVSYGLNTSDAEDMRTSDPTSTDAINLYGNGYANTLEGNAGPNVIAGGSGEDHLWGYGGDDTYYLYRPFQPWGGATVHEAPGEGTDTIMVYESYTLPAGWSVEILKLYDPGGVYEYRGGDLTGNELDNTLEADSGSSILNGGAGADQMWGFAGSDTYHVDNAGDTVHEVAGEGNDTIIAKISLALAAGLSVETLRTSSSLSTAVIDMTGNELANTMVGNAAANTLDGGVGDDILWGYDGNDTLTGGSGADAFVFVTEPGPGNIDTITDFVAADDTINIDNAVFAGLPPGALAAGAFNTGPAATEADDRIIYNTATGQLMFDVDGLGGAAAVQFAMLSGAPVIAANDFLVI